MMRIFRLMTPQDLKMVVLVCKLWREMGEHPSLWTWCRVTVASKGDVEMLGMRRLQQINTVHVCRLTSWYHWYTTRSQQNGVHVLEQLFKTLDVGTLTRLRDIGGLRNTNLSSIEPGLMGRVMSRMEKVEMVYYCNITNIQADALFTAIAEDSTVKRLFLNMTRNNLSHVQPVVMAQAVHRVQKVRMVNTQLTKQQVTAILRQCVEGETIMEELYLGGNNEAMAGVEQGLITQAREKLGRGLNIWYIWYIWYR